MKNRIVTPNGASFENRTLVTMIVNPAPNKSRKIMTMKLLADTAFPGRMEIMLFPFTLFI
jgi:hypothetical protein